MGIIKLNDIGLIDEEIDYIKYVARNSNCQQMRLLDKPLDYEDIKIDVDKSRIK